MKQDVRITFTVELTRDIELGDALDPDVLSEVAFYQLQDDIDDGGIDPTCVEITYL